MKFRSFALFAASLTIIIAASALGCGSSNGGKRVILSLALQPAFANATTGSDTQFTATGTFNKPPSPVKVTPLVWIETASDGLHAGSGIAVVGQSGLAHCNASGTTWISANAATGGLNKYGDPRLVWGTAQLNCP